MTGEPASRKRLLQELMLERFAPVMPPDPPEPARKPRTAEPERRPTGTGWPGDTL